MCTNHIENMNIVKGAPSIGSRRPRDSHRAYLLPWDAPWFDGSPWDQPDAVPGDPDGCQPRVRRTGRACAPVTRRIRALIASGPAGHPGPPGRGAGSERRAWPRSRTLPSMSQPSPPPEDDPALLAADTAIAPPPDGPGALDEITRFVGLRWEDPQTVWMRVRPELINRGGLLSGVATYAMVDYCMGSTLWVQTTPAERIATISISINYIQTATEGEVVCRSELDRRNRSVGILKSTIHDEQGRLLVTAIGSYSIFTRR